MRQKRFATLAALAALAVALAGSSPPPGRVRVAGTSVTMQPPAGFSPAERFPGFQLPDQGASIMVTEIPGPVATIRQGMTGRTLATRGMTLIESKSLKLRGNDILLLHVSQEAGGTEFLKWMLVGGDAQTTVMVVGTFPAASADLSAPVKRSVLSASWSGAEEVDPFEGLQFRVTSTAALKLAKRVANMLVLTETGTIEPSGTDQAVLGIGSSLSDVHIGNLAEFSKERAAKSPHMGHLHNVRGNELSIGELPGYELVAEANDSKSGEPVGFYQVLLADGQTYYLAQGFVKPERMSKVLPEFRRVMESFRLVRPRDAARSTTDR